MLTKSATKHLRRAIKARLGLTDRQASSIIERNWANGICENLQGCVALLNNAYDTNPNLGIYVPGNYGYYEWVGHLRLEKSDLERWNVMSLEEAYALPEGFRTLSDCFEWVDATITDCRPRDEDGIIVTVDFGEGRTREMAMLADINDAQGLLSYAREKIGRQGRVCFEAEPKGERSLKAHGMAIVEMITVDYDSVDLDELYGEPAKLAA
tara:strand:+ start:1789 stop:2418 length:630 start_codon:yes stop_codon:yes gene_type:complete